MLQGQLGQLMWIVFDASREFQKSGLERRFFAILGSGFSIPLTIFLPPTHGVSCDIVFPWAFGISSKRQKKPVRDF